VLVYTVNHEVEMQRLFSMGVDGIFTDDPILARNVLDKIPPFDLAMNSPKNL
jgi:glycerophosphoryl diester phosphodiesterase